MDVVVRVDVRRIGPGQLAEARELGRERASGVAGLVDLGAVLDVVETDRQPGVRARQLDGVRGRGPVDH